jgi:hypothetical protein
VTVERIERALLVLAYIMELDGAVYVPLYDRLEQDLEALRRTENTMERARQRLETNRHRLVEIGLKVKGK